MSALAKANVVRPAPAKPVAGAPVARREGWMPTNALSNVLVLAGVVIAVVLLVVVVGLDGWRYYTTPLRVRAYALPHKLLRPSGLVGQSLGIVGLGLILATLVYVVRKRSKRLSKIGNSKAWLEAHIFCGLVGPALVTIHTSFKFNGIISVAYWSMALVVASGFVGRYLYVRIPKTMRGSELSLGEVEDRADELREQMLASGLPPALRQRIAEAETEIASRKPGFAGLLFGEAGFRRRLRRLEAEVAGSGVSPELAAEVRSLLEERLFLLRRLAYLERTKKLFSLWHVFHKPLVWLMLAIATGHVALALYMGYSIVKF